MVKCQLYIVEAEVVSKVTIYTWPRVLYKEHMTKHFVPHWYVITYSAGETFLIVLLKPWLLEHVQVLSALLNIPLILGISSFFVTRYLSVGEIAM